MTLMRRLAPPLFFALVAFLILSNVLLHSGTHIPGQGVNDYYHFAWSYWWIDHALTTPGVAFYQTDYVFYPHVSNLAVHTLAAFWFPLWALAEPLVGIFAAFNVIVYVAFWLTGILTYALLRQEGVARGLALFGGVALQVTPLLFKATWWLSLNLLGVFWYPLHLLIWGQVAQLRTDRRWINIVWAVVQGIALWAAALHDLQYLLFLVFILGPYAALTLIKAADMRQRVRLLLLGMVALVVWLALMWGCGLLPAFLEFDRSRAVEASGGLLYQMEFPDSYLRVSEYWRAGDIGGFMIVVFVVTVIANLVRRGDQHDHWQRWVWCAVALIALAITPGPEIVVSGTTIPTPYNALHHLMGGIFRAPERLGAIFVLATLIFAGRTWTPILTKHPRVTPWVTGILLLGLLAHHHALASIPVQPAPKIYDFYEMMAAEPYDYVVVEVPVAAGDGVATVGNPKDLAPMFYGAIHGKKMITGHLSRAYVDYFWPLRTDHPVLSWLGQRRPLDPVVVREQLERMIYNYPIGYFVIRQDAIGLESPTNNEITGYFNSLDDLLCPLLVEDSLVVYRTAWHPAGCPPRIPPETAPGTYTIDIGAPGDELYLGWGWHAPESPPGINWRWAGRLPQADLYVDLPPGAYTLTLAAQSFWQAREVQLVVNDISLGSITVSADQMGTFSVEVPAEVIGTGDQVMINLIYAAPTVPAEVGQSADPRPLAIAVDWVRFAGD